MPASIGEGRVVLLAGRHHCGSPQQAASASSHLLGRLPPGPEWSSRRAPRLTTSAIRLSSLLTLAGGASSARAWRGPRPVRHIGSCTGCPAVASSSSSSSASRQPEAWPGSEDEDQQLVEEIDDERGRSEFLKFANQGKPLPEEQKTSQEPKRPQRGDIVECIVDELMPRQNLVFVSIVVKDKQGFIATYLSGRIHKSELLAPQRLDSYHPGDQLTAVVIEEPRLIEAVQLGRPPVWRLSLKRTSLAKSFNRMMDDDSLTAETEKNIRRLVEPSLGGFVQSSNKREATYKDIYHFIQRLERTEKILRKLGYGRMLHDAMRDYERMSDQGWWSMMRVRPGSTAREEEESDAEPQWAEDLPDRHRWEDLLARRRREEAAQEPEKPQPPPPSKKKAWETFDGKLLENDRSGLNVQGTWRPETSFRSPTDDR